VERIPVVSSNIASIGYDPETFILEVEFHSGGIYQYFDVPQQVYIDFVNAESKGRFLWQYIRDVYEYTRVE